MSGTQRYILAVLDDYAELSPKIFHTLKNVDRLETITFYRETLDTRTKEGLDEAISRLKPYQIISSMRERTQFPAELISHLPNLKLLLNSSARNRSIDLAAAKAQGIIVTGTDGRYVDNKGNPDFDNTTQHTWSLILALTSHIPEDNHVLRNDQKAWQTGFMVSLAGKTIGLVGLGKLGGRTARTAVLGFGMKVIAWSENLTQEKADDLAVRYGFGKGTFEVVGKRELFERSDVVSVHLVFSERSKNTVAAAELEAMKKTAFLVNTARAGIIDEDALFETLSQGRIAGAALDVWWAEPTESGSRWRKPDYFGTEGRSRLIMSPHMGYVEIDVMTSWYREQAEILDAWLEGKDLSDRFLKGS